MIWPLFRYILMAAVRDRLVLSVIAIIAVVTSLSYFFGASVVTEQDDFARTFGAFGFRLFGVAALSLFVVTFVRRSFESRDVDYLLSRPIGRTAFVLTHAAAFSTIAFLLSLILGGIGIYSWGGISHGGIALWWASIALEFMIVANVAMFFSFIIASPTASMLAVFAFYLLSRLMGEILGILQAETQTGLMKMLSKIMEFISIVIPRLDMAGRTEWILYGMPAEFPYAWVLGQAAAVLCLVIVATVIDMRRRQF
ncbi:MAG: hypothetical protein DI626_09910 [Micavibrio aeruginosavorus]|uniref:ABC transporter permease n=1 Tax=Micavibrio aeruginosavorus TaxID=349221 RepID=A0A2W4ZPL8_9BACT|nr:MAG: hypothetical protein DI626_09910 [Micavibrio aeruginosavorus]